MKIYISELKTNCMHGKSYFYNTTKIENFQNKKEKVQIGYNTHIRGELLIFPYGGEIKVGNNSFIGEQTKIWSAESIIIGDYVAIAHNVNIMDFNHETNHLERAHSLKQILTQGHPKIKGNIITAPIIIEDYVAIYSNVNIMRGVRLGKGSIISAGSVVFNDVPPFSLVMGNPARVFGKVN
jgi:acetyltransferase-like isoleucine patch superfamily enzyme